MDYSPFAIAVMTVRISPSGLYVIFKCLPPMILKAFIPFIVSVHGTLKLEIENWKR